MHPAHRLAAIGLGLSALFALAGIFALVAFLFLSHMSFRSALHGASEGIANSNDLALIKKLSLLLVDVYREERASRLTVVWLGLGALIGTTTVTAAIYARILIVLHAAQGRTPESENALKVTANDGAFQSFRSRALDGTLKLWQAFWLIYVPVPFLLAVVLTGIHRSFYRLGLQNIPELALVLWSLAASAIWMSLFAASVIVWRCSRNTSWKLWTYVTRVVVVLMIAVPLIKAIVLWSPFLI